jgi:hypothetical protein
MSSHKSDYKCTECKFCEFYAQKYCDEFKKLSKKAIDYMHKIGVHPKGVGITPQVECLSRFVPHCNFTDVKELSREFKKMMDTNKCELERAMKIIAEKRSMPVIDCEISKEQHLDQEFKHVINSGDLKAIGEFIDKNIENLNFTQNCFTDNVAWTISRIKDVNVTNFLVEKIGYKNAQFDYFVMMNLDDTNVMKYLITKHFEWFSHANNSHCMINYFIITDNTDMLRFIKNTTTLDKSMFLSTTTRDYYYTGLMVIPELYHSCGKCPTKETIIEFVKLFEITETDVEKFKCVLCNLEYDENHMTLTENKFIVMGKGLTSADLLIDLIKSIK